MKKLVSVMLAAAMLLNLATVSLAVVDTFDLAGHSAIVHHIRPYYYKFSKDDNVMKKTRNPNIDYGDTNYFPLVDENDRVICEEDAVKGVSPKAEWEQNGEMVSSVAVVRKKVATSGFGYFLAITLKGNSTTEGDDLFGEVTIRKSSGDYKFAKNSEGKRQVKLNVEVYVCYELRDEAPDLNVVTEDIYLYNFKKVDDITDFELTFEEFVDATFTVGLRGVGKMLLCADSEFNDAVADANDFASLEFFNGNGADFYHRGEMFLPAEPGSFLYELKDGNLSVVQGAVYDEGMEGFYFETRYLGSYVIFDRKLNVYGEADEIEAAEIP